MGTDYVLEKLPDVSGSGLMEAGRYSYDVSELMRGGFMENPNFTKGHLLADEVNVDLDVLRSLVVDGVGCHVDGADVVAEDNDSGGQLNMELLE